jgi:hypothetical protein
MLPIGLFESITMLTQATGRFGKSSSSSTTQDSNIAVAPLDRRHLISPLTLVGGAILTGLGKLDKKAPMDWRGKDTTRTNVILVVFVSQENGGYSLPRRSLSRWVIGLPNRPSKAITSFNIWCNRFQDSAVALSCLGRSIRSLIASICS